MLVSSLAKNQVIIHDKEATFFTSYGTTIVKTCFENGVKKVYLDKHYYNYSSTTIRYRNAFLEENTKNSQQEN